MGLDPEEVRDRRTPRSVPTFIAALGALTLGLTITYAGPAAPFLQRAPLLISFVALLVMAEYLFVRFRYGGEINSLNLIEAVIAPLIVAFDALIVVTVVVLSQIIVAVVRKNTPIKGAFNVVQWGLVAAAGSSIFHLLSPTGSALSIPVAADLLITMAAIGLVNQVAFMTVLALAKREGLREVLTGVFPVIAPGWVIGWSVNALMGLLFAFAFEANPAAVLLFPVPLAVLHLGYRGYAETRSDRERLSGLHRAARILAEPLDPQDALSPFLREVVESFGAKGAALVLVDNGSLNIHSYDLETNTIAVERQSKAAGTFESASVGYQRAIRVNVSQDSELAHKLVKSRWRDCLSAPMGSESSIIGRLLVYDQAAFEGFEAGELAVIEAIAREAASTFTKGRLLGEIIEERRKLSEIVTNTSDGILTLDAEGTVRSWNPAMECITGFSSSEVIGVPQALDRLEARDAYGARVRLDRWMDSPELPPQIRISADKGGRRLSCSYSRATDEVGTATLVVVVRDVSSQDEVEALRKRVGRLAEADAARRAVVEQLQQAVMPLKPWVTQTELGVSYLASDPSAPTGGDLYDWVQLPSGELHVAVVDVLGHGVAATKDALTIVHALRLLAMDGTPLGDLIGRADRLLGAQNPNLVATAILVRYDPHSGKVRLAGGGHPPALLVKGKDQVSQVWAEGGAIGWPGAGSRGVVELDLVPGDSLILYTDGLVEARKDIIEGTFSLMRYAAEMSEATADAMASGLMQRSIWGSDRRDDSVVLALRRTERLTESWSRSSSPSSIKEIRDLSSAWLTRVGVAGETASDAKIVVGELLANAAVAADTEISCRMTVDGGRLCIEVEDDGRGSSETLKNLSEEPPGMEAERGRGLFIVRSLASEVTLKGSTEGAIVRAVIEISSRDRVKPRTDRVGATL